MKEGKAGWSNSHITPFSEIILDDFFYLIIVAYKKNVRIFKVKVAI